MNSKAPQPELRVIWNPPVNLTLVSMMVDRTEVVYATVSENNFGSLHHITLTSQQLSKSLAKIDRGVNDNDGDPSSFSTIDSGDVWTDHPHKGFVTIWETEGVRGRHRAVNLTYDQVGKLLEHFFPNG